MTTLCLAACSTEGAARDVLAEQGYAGIELTREGSSAFGFTATKDGANCEGSIEITSLPGYSDHSVSASCTSAVASEAAPAKPSSLAEAAFGASIAYEGGGPRVEGPRDVESQAAAALVRALAVGDRNWIAAHSSDGLRENLLASNDLTIMQAILTRFGDVTLEPLRREASQEGLEELAVYEIDVPGGYAAELRVGFTSNGFQNFTLRGSRWESELAAMQAQKPAIKRYGVYYATRAKGLLNDVEIDQGEDLTIMLAMGGFARKKGRSVISYKATVRGGTTAKIEVKPTEFTSDGFVHADLALSNVGEGEHHVEIVFRDGISKKKHREEFDVIVKKTAAG